MSQGRIFTSSDVTGDRELSCDVCIVGSGAGGGMLANELTLRGLDVVMLEEGGYHTRRDFDLREDTAYPLLYQELGNRGTSDLSITILQGRTVGGGTTVNWCSSFRTPSHVLALWRERYGLESLTDAALAPHFDWVEERLSIREWPQDRQNPNNRLLWEGLGKLGYARGLIKRNVHNCANIGYCGMGCPIDAKQSMLVTLLPDAVSRGMSLYANASVRRVEWSGRRAVAVHVEMLDESTQRPNGRRLTVRPKVVAVCGGALNSPALLLRSGLSAGGRVGRRTFLHPVLASIALFDEPVEPFSGAPQSVYSHHFSDRGGKMGFFIESAPIHPMLAATAASGTGAEHQAVLAKLPHLQASLALTIDGLLEGDEGGTVALRSHGHERLLIDYPLNERNWEAFRFAQKELARIQLAAGAREVHTLHVPPVRIRREADLALIDDAPWEKLRVKLFTAHQMGGCAMGRDAMRSVVDPELRYHPLDNLFVVDGSVFPTAVGVNPSESIYALSRWAAPFVAGAVPG